MSSALSGHKRLEEVPLDNPENTGGTRASRHVTEFHVGRVA
jgi:hypothetical protein